jgi:hypothetical protein
LQQQQEEELLEEEEVEHQEEGGVAMLHLHQHRWKKEIRFFVEKAREKNTRRNSTGKQHGDFPNLPVVATAVKTCWTTWTNWSIFSSNLCSSWCNCCWNNVVMFDSIVSIVHCTS